MGINAQTSVPKFTSGDVLTAANTNLLSNAPPVFAGTATRDAAFGGAGEKTLAEGQLCYLEDSNIVQYYDGAAWATVGPASAGALVRVGGGSLSGAATTFSSVFSATYDAYDIVCTNLTTGSSGVGIELTLGSTVTGYYYGGVGAPPSGSSVLFQGNNVAFWEASVVDTGSSGATYKLWNPFLSKKTIFQSQRINPSTTGNMGTVQGMVNNTTSYTSFTMSVSGTTWTSGTVNIYGYALS